ncbi:alpha/beta hydrolase [Hamadaea tsunoensis]|uniref:alpha/beta hydrolase n=1 Tax=Hamadaea tsunoensis TaxID=53368 RepID=UPI0006845E80|nr:alpha/beta hydrolase [Hamadaea tsunoensis]
MIATTAGPVVLAAAEGAVAVTALAGVTDGSASWRAAASWAGFADRLASRLSELEGAAAGLAASWSSPAADAAAVTLADLRSSTAALRMPVARTHELLVEHAIALDRAGELLRGGDAAAAGQLARMASERLRAGLAGLSVEPASLSPAHSGPPVDAGPAADEPPTQGGPAAVHTWWAGLSARERQRLLDEQPGRIGNLDGIPAVDRDTANRAILARDLRDGAPNQPGLATLADRLDRQTPRAYLLGLDTAGDGKAVIALGDPDSAANVLTFVPGMNAGLNRHLAVDLDRTASLAAAAHRADTGASTAAILWVGYDAPDTIFQAASSGYADRARADLHAFQDGLAAAHHGPIGEQSLVGHSYGTLVIGETARDVGVRADDLVFLGSPGVGVEHAADLHVAPGTVWAASADNDILGLAAPSVKEFLTDLIKPRYFGDPMPSLWHGHNPADDGFGAHVFAAANHTNPVAAHLSYWDADNPALASVALIATGQDARVTPL